jgi:hypothetical protein
MVMSLKLCGFRGLCCIVIGTWFPNTLLRGGIKNMSFYILVALRKLNDANEHL